MSTDADLARAQVAFPTAWRARLFIVALVTWNSLLVLAFIAAAANAPLAAFPLGAAALVLAGPILFTTMVAWWLHPPVSRGRPYRLRLVTQIRDALLMARQPAGDDEHGAHPSGRRS